MTANLFPTGAPGARAHRRIALYSHDTQGLGHCRRNSMIAAAITAEHPDVSVLLVTGVREAATIPLPERTEVVVLPGVAKNADGTYRSRAGIGGYDDIIAIRSRALAGVLGAWAPDLFVVDKVARGLGGELEPVLPMLRHRHGTHTVLGIRDVLDDVVTTRREWDAARTTEAIVELYDQVWVYGDPQVFDPATEYGWPAAVRRKVRYTGYLADGREDLLPGTTAAPATASSGGAPYVLAMVGGGQDGATIADAFAAAALPAGHRGLLVTGPYLPDDVAERVHRRAAERTDLQVERFVTDVPALVRGAAATISMGGYNSVCEILSAGGPALIVPRVTPRLEQAVRADRLAELGLLDVARAEALTPAALAGWIASVTTLRHDPAAPHPIDLPRAPRPIDLNGLAALPSLTERLLAPRRLASVRRAG